jgi:hypothetical protein
MAIRTFDELLGDHAGRIARLERRLNKIAGSVTLRVPAVIQARLALERAIALNAAPVELAALQQAILNARGISDGDPWRKPTGADEAYPLGAIVSHIDKVWQSSVPANIWEPPEQWTEQP